MTGSGKPERGRNYTPVAETGEERRPCGDQPQIHDEGTCNKYEPKGASLVGCPNHGRWARLSEEGGRVRGRAAKGGSERIWIS